MQRINVFVAALRSLEGASAKVLDRCLARADQAVTGATLFAEYEELVQRESLWMGVPVRAAERVALLDAFCAAAIASQLISGGDPTFPIRPMTMFWSWRLPVAWNIWSRTTSGTSDRANSHSRRRGW